MRAALLLLCLILCSCGLGHSRVGEPQTIQSGKDRLTLRWAPSEIAGGFDFDAVIWETKEGEMWKQRATMTQEEFELGTDRARWVDELHSFDPESGDAIIKVVEGDAPKGSDNVSYVYSWREWNILTNGQVRMIRVCEDPFEKY